MKVLSTYAGVATQLLKAQSLGDRQDGVSKEKAAANLNVELKNLSDVIAKAKAEIARGQYPEILDASSVTPVSDTAYVGGSLTSWDGGVDPLKLTTWVITWGAPPNLDAIVDPSKLNETRAMLSVARRFVSRQPGAAQPKNPFSPTSSPTYTFPKAPTSPKVGGHPVSAAPAAPASNWWDHDPMKAAGAAAIAASNANAYTDIANAVASGQAATAAWQGGSVAYGTPVNSDNSPAPVGNMAPQIQPGSGSQFTPPPPPPTYQMTGLAEVQSNELLDIAIKGALIYFGVRLILGWNR